MLHPSGYLWSTAIFIWAHPGRFAFYAHKRGAACRTILHKLHRLASRLPRRNINPRDFWNNFTAFLNIEAVTFMYVKIFNYVLIVERRPFHNSS